MSILSIDLFETVLCGKNNQVFFAVNCQKVSVDFAIYSVL